MSWPVYMINIHMDKSKWYLIRKERLLKSLEENTIVQLQQDTVRGFPGTKARQNSPDVIRIIQKSYVTFIGQGFLLIKSLADNKGKKYNTEIMFEDVEYEDEDTPENITIFSTDKEYQHFQPIVLAQNNARVRCTCLDFFYRFAHNNYKADSLYGEVPPIYQRVLGPYGEPSKRPPVNPLRVPGLCKHLYALVTDLQREKIVK
jgi:hypothetical protein